MSSFTNITLKELEVSKTYVNPKTTALSYQHPMDYAHDFIEKCNDLNCDLNIRVDTNAMNANDDNSLNISYDTVVFRATVPEANLYLDGTAFNELKSEFGFILSLGGLAPEIRVYSGKRVTICDNGCIFGADDITTVKLVSSHEPINKALKSYIDNIQAKSRAYLDRIEQMNNTFYHEAVKGQSNSTLNSKIGEIVRYAMGNNKLGVQVATGMIKNIQDIKSNYRIYENKISGWTLYNACTEEIKKSPIKDEMAKVQLLEGIQWY